MLLADIKMSLKEGLGLGFFISKTLFERLGIKMKYIIKISQKVEL